ncbi:putative insuline-like growth factor family member [Lymphocystis disease virus 4]|uniref:Putative insuline-like growth factor family member n=1 Tax=Lymphocystis disease virus 4 TaxID=2704413 RepID=A0A6B9XK06_9VIRU|nr:putative insuline-like growth factor family member [Lymphocystis disease virus 4]QHR78565.1 putative insuline-like growth factor family member [Lymphocystis disease virus 4]
MKEFVLIIIASSSVLSKPLCGSELVDALELVCHDRGGFYSPTIKEVHTNRKTQSGIVEKCCRKEGCDYAYLTQYCAH